MKLEITCKNKSNFYCVGRKKKNVTAAAVVVPVVVLVVLIAIAMILYKRKTANKSLNLPNGTLLTTLAYSLKIKKLIRVSLCSSKC